jgi:hypothetical protein
MWSLFSVPPRILQKSVQEGTTIQTLVLLNYCNFPFRAMNSLCREVQRNEHDCKWSTSGRSTQALLRRSLLSKCHTFHGTRVNVISLTPVKKVQSSLRADLLYRTSQKSVNEYSNNGYRFTYAPK